MIGSITRPGITHSDATAKPIERARGGMARLSVARMPGATMAKAATITEWAAMATPTLGAAATTIRASATAIVRSEEHTSELKPLMRTPYAVFCLQKRQL